MNFSTTKNEDYNNQETETFFKVLTTKAKEI